MDRRRAARVMGVVALALAIASAAQIEQLLATANDEPPGAALLRAHPSALPGGPRLHDRLAVLLVDGMRADEAPRLRSWRELAPGSITGELALEPPALSRPFYHQLLTGVPAVASGVRTNRFDGRARADSLTDRVRAAGGSVTIVAEGLDWIRRMHGRAEDGGSDEGRSISPERLDRALRAFARAPSPALLVVHVTSTDATSHAGGIASEAHARALDRADATLERVAQAVPALVVLSDHGHIARGGHGGPEPEVARAPLLARAPGLRPRVLGAAIPTRCLAATFAAWLGVPPPREATGAPVAALLPQGHPRHEAEHARLASLAAQGAAEARGSLVARQRWTLPLAFLAALMMLGPLKRAFGFDRAVPLAILGWPACVIGLHLALGRPLSLSAIDGRVTHGARVAALGLTAALITFVISRALASGDPRDRTRRAAASVGWSAIASALLANAWVGFALGPWPLSPHATYLALLACGAAAPALLACGVALLVSARRDPAATLSVP